MVSNSDPLNQEQAKSGAFNFISFWSSIGHKIGVM